MPTYEFVCIECDHKFEKMQKITDNTLPSCPKCNGRSKKIISPSTFILKGSGWYKDSYGLKNNKNDD